MPEPERSACAPLAAERAARRSTSPPGRCSASALLRLGEGEHALLLAIHHIVSDGWSIGVLVRELAALYGALAAGRLALLPPSCRSSTPTTPSGSAAGCSGEVLEAQLAYWSASWPARRRRWSCRPTGRGPRSRASAAGACRWRSRPGWPDGWRPWAAAAASTLFMTLLAAFATLLSRYSGQDDVVVGAPVANRDRAELEGLIGFFVNTLVLRADLAGDPASPSLARQVRETALGAYAHQDLPFEKLVDELRPERDLSRTPVFQVMFALQNAPRVDVRMAGLDAVGR